VTAPSLDVAGPREIAPGIKAWITPDGGWGKSNAALVSGVGASLLVDTLWDVPHTERMLEAFRPALDQAPIRLVVNTHSDGEHWFGNQLLEDCPILATAAAARRMKHGGPREMSALLSVTRVFQTLGTLPVPRRREFRATAKYFRAMVDGYRFESVRATRPDSTFSGKIEREIGGRRVRMIEVGPAHTSGDLIVHLPDDQVVVAGDVVFHGVTPVLWDGSARNWIKACERILRLEPATVIPGHGPLAGPAAVDEMRKYWEFVRAAARRHFEKSRPAPKAALLIARSDEFREQSFANWTGPERLLINVVAIYRRLMGKRHRLSVMERLSILRKTAVLAEEFQSR
jgi:cyclase